MRIEARHPPLCIHPDPSPVAPQAVAAIAPVTTPERIELERVSLRRADGARCKPPPAPPPPIPVGRSSGVVGGLLRGIGSFFSGLFGGGRCLAAGASSCLQQLLAGRPRDAFASLAHGVVGSVFCVALHAASAVVSAARKGGRPLTQDEATTLRKALGRHVRTDLIRVVEGGGPLNRGNAAITIGHTIFVARTHLPLSADLLVHEATHTVQYDQIGASYLSRALLAQGDADGYDFRRAIGRGEVFHEMNLESQAEFRQQLELAGWDASTEAHVYAAPDGWPAILSTDPTAFGGQGMDVTAAAHAARP